MVELARARGWTVVASNIPRRLATDVSRKGLAAVEALSPPSARSSRATSPARATTTSIDSPTR